MARKRTPTGLSGIVAIDKPSGVTSHDVVNTIRQLTGERRVGHTGTLDPLATGLLMVCVGPATRLADYLMAGNKTYEARICFGAATNTDDTEGEVIRTAEVPEKLFDESFASEYLASLIGEVKQVPPAFSAIKQNGVKAYKAARAGEALALEPRTVYLHSAVVKEVGEGYWDISLVVSKGFYVRSFARDVGEHLGTAAHLGQLQRSASGSISLEQATPLDEFAAGENLPFMDPVLALGLPAVEIDALQAERVSNGMPLTIQSGVPFTSELVSIVHKGYLLALYELVGRSGMAKPRIVLPGGVSYVTSQDS